jgi:hypothetical protein
MKQAIAAGIVLMLAAVAGCGGRKIAPVSGTVTLDGEPYPNAIVSFQPIGTRANIEPGRGSVGVTDEQGRFTLRYDGGGRSGAVIGKHQVRIFTDLGTEPEPGEDAPARPARKLVEPIPPEWHEFSKKEFDVPAGGTTKADFAIETKPAKR